MGIVEEIVTACKTQLDGLLTDYKRIAYEHETGTNSDRGITKKYGFVPGAATFAEGRAMGFTTMDHAFTLKLVDFFQDKDNDDALNAALYKQYEVVQNALKELQKSRLALPTPTNRVVLISGLSFDDPEVFSDNSTVELRANFIIRYSYRNN